LQAGDPGPAAADARPGKGGGKGKGGGGKKTKGPVVPPHVRPWFTLLRIDERNRIIPDLHNVLSFLNSATEIAAGGAPAAPERAMARSRRKASSRWRRLASRFFLLC
jgi:hypothetical protein